MGESLPHPSGDGLDWLGGFRDDAWDPPDLPGGRVYLAPTARGDEVTAGVPEPHNSIPVAPRGSRNRLLIGALIVLLALETSAVVRWVMTHPGWQTGGQNHVVAGPSEPQASPAENPPTELVVGRSAGEIPTIQEAVARSAPGGRIRIRPGIYTGKVVLDRPIELVGDGPRAGVVVGNSTGVVLAVTGERVTVRGLTIARREGVQDPQGFAVDIGGRNVLLDDCDITSGAAAGVSVHGGVASATLRKCAVHDGKTVGVQASEGGRVVLESCQVTGQVSTGVVVSTGATGVLRQCKLRDGQAGGVVARERGSVTLDDCDVVGHKFAQVAAEDGGTLSLLKCRIGDGASHGISVSKSVADLDGCTVTANGGEGVCTLDTSRTVLRNCKIVANKKCGLYFGNQSSGLAEACEIRDSGTGNVVALTGACPVITGCTITGGETGIVVESKATGEFLDCDISGHETGVFVFGRGNPVMRNCKIHGNRASAIYVAGHGRGTFDGCDLGPHPQSVVLLVSGAEPTLRNCTIRGGDLHGVTIWDGAAGVLERCTITGMKGAGVYAEDTDGHSILSDCKIRGCQMGGVQFATGSRGTLIGCDISGNKGGNVHARAAEVDLIQCKILAGIDLGVVALASGRIALTDCDVTDHPENSLQIVGSAEATLTRCRVSGGKKYGVAVLDKSRVTLIDSDVFGHGDHDVAVGGEADLVVRGGSIRDGKGNGLAAVNNSRATITGCRISGHERAEVFVSHTARIHLQRCDVSIGRSNGVYARLDSTATLDGCELRGGGGDTVFAMETATVAVRDCRLLDGHANGIKAIDSSRIDVTGGEVSGQNGTGVGAWGGGELTLVRVLVQKSGLSGVFVGGSRATALLLDCRLMANATDGLTVTGEGRVRVDHCHMEGNQIAIRAEDGGRATVTNCVAEKNTVGPWACAGSSSVLSGSGNTPPVTEIAVVAASAPPLSGTEPGWVLLFPRPNPPGPTGAPGLWNALFPRPNLEAPPSGPFAPPSFASPEYIRRLSHLGSPERWPAPEVPVP